MTRDNPAPARLYMPRSKGLKIHPPHSVVVREELARNWGRQLFNLEQRDFGKGKGHTSVGRDIEAKDVLGLERLTALLGPVLPAP